MLPRVLHMCGNGDISAVSCGFPVDVGCIAATLLRGCGSG